MAAVFTYTYTLANLAAGNQPLAKIDQDFNDIGLQMLSLNSYGNFYVDSGSVNAYAVTVNSPQTVSLSAGLPIQFKPINNNTGASTLAINGGAAKEILRQGGAALSAGDIVTTGIAEVQYDGTNFILLSPYIPGQITRGSPTAATSLTAVTFTGIPAGINNLNMMLSGISTNGTSNYLIQVGSTTFSTSGYAGGAGSVAGSPSASDYTTGFGIKIADASITIQGQISLNLLDPSTNTWTAGGNFAIASGATTIVNAGVISLAGALDRIRLTTVNGTDVFDAGKVNINYQ